MKQTQMKDILETLIHLHEQIGEAIVFYTHIENEQSDREERLRALHQKVSKP
jgi:hypothetical protein